MPPGYSPISSRATTSFAYDTSYRLSSISNPRGAIAYTYTAADQVQTYQAGSDPAVAFSYYDDGSVKTITRSGVNPVAYSYLLTGQRSQSSTPTPPGSTRATTTRAG